MKPRIFIGSSSEALEVAKRVKEYFSTDYDCYLWSDDIFKNNESFLDTLMKSASLFDFGFMVLSSDDGGLIRNKLFETPRDNMLFEYGLFLGRVGTMRAFPIVEEGAKIPTDLFGITCTMYKTQKDTQGNKVATDSLEIGLQKLKKQVDENLNLGYLGFLPSTVSAISYFEGFVKLAAEWIIENTPNLEIDGKTYQSAKLIIKMPETLDADIKKSAMIFYKKMGMNETQIETKHRCYPIHFVTKPDADTLEIFDMPTILNGINKAIDMYFKVGHIGKTIEQQLTEENEMNNFKRVLQLLINDDAFSRECVEVI